MQFLEVSCLQSHDVIAYKILYMMMNIDTDERSDISINIHHHIQYRYAAWV